jgi:formiminotetrahydrofolate cyclodeaminase
MDYKDEIQSALAAIASTDSPLGSGAAAALSLSLGIECLALQLSLTTHGPDGVDYASYHAALRDHLDQWRQVAHQAFIDDPAAVHDIIQARRLRDAAPAVERKGHVEQELNALQRANAVLLSLMEVSFELESHADLMLRGRGAAHASGEAATAVYLAGAATLALGSMLTANVVAARERVSRYGVDPIDVSAIREIAGRIQNEAVRERLKRELAQQNAAVI